MRRIYPDYWQIHHRRSLRLQNYDYAARGSYFVTIRVAGGECVFGDIQDSQVHLNPCGQIARQCWGSLSEHFPFLALDVFIVMPNHVHGVLHLYRGVPDGNPPAGVVYGMSGSVIRGDADEQLGIVRRDVACNAPTNGEPRPDDGILRGPETGSLGSVIRSYKSAVTRHINILRGAPGAKLWQRNYYESIVHTREDLERIRSYIRLNPVRWRGERHNKKTSFRQS